MTLNNIPDENSPQWWRELSDEQQAFILRLTGSNQFPNPSLEEVGRLFDETRKRIREIEERALSRLKKDDDDNSTTV